MLQIMVFRGWHLHFYLGHLTINKTQINNQLLAKKIPLKHLTLTKITIINILTKNDTQKPQIPYYQ